MDHDSYSIEDLTERAGIPVRTLRYYVAEGLLPGPGARGRGARYGSEHLWRLSLIRQMTAQHIPLAQIRERLAKLSDVEVHRLVEPGARREAPSGSGPSPAPRAFLEGLLARAQRAAPARPPAPVEGGETWRRFALRPGLELAMRADVESRYAPLVGRILKILSEVE